MDWDFLDNRAQKSVWNVAAAAIGAFIAILFVINLFG